MSREDERLQLRRMRQERLREREERLRVVAERERVWRGIELGIDLRRVRTAREVIEAHDLVIGAMLAGELTPEEARAVGGVLETHRKMIQTEVLERNLAELKRQLYDEFGLDLDDVFMEMQRRSGKVVGAGEGSAE